METYKYGHSLEQRTNECSRILNKHPTRVPIIVCKDKNCALDEIDKRKYLTPKDLTLAQFIYVIRKRIKLKPEEALFIMINNKIVPGKFTLSEVYEDNKDEDGFLYITYTSENTFG